MDTMPEREHQLELVFLGSGGPVQLPSFHCTCRVCEDARANPGQRRTRAGIALVGKETCLVDAGPDIEVQLERECIRWVDRIFITHWHFDHIAGLAAFGEPGTHMPLPPIHLYLPGQVAFHFEQELAHLKRRFVLHAVMPGEQIALPDATWEVVKTDHTDHSIGFIVSGPQRFAYLVDSITPPPDTMSRLTDLDFVILEAKLDELDESTWKSFSLPQAVACWQQIGAPQCILTHISGHSWKDGRLVAGLSARERSEFEANTPGLAFARDGMRVPLSQD